VPKAVKDVRDGVLEGKVTGMSQNGRWSLHCMSRNSRLSQCLSLSGMTRRSPHSVPLLALAPHRPPHPALRLHICSFPTLLIRYHTICTPYRPLDLLWVSFRSPTMRYLVAHFGWRVGLSGYIVGLCKGRVRTMSHSLKNTYLT
jgi:hypothetical protein